MITIEELNQAKPQAEVANAVFSVIAMHTFITFSAYLFSSTFLEKHVASKTLRYILKTTLGITLLCAEYRNINFSLHHEPLLSLIGCAITGIVCLFLEIALHSCNGNPSHGKHTETEK